MFFFCIKRLYHTDNLIQQLADPRICAANVQYNGISPRFLNAPSSSPVNANSAPNAQVTQQQPQQQTFIIQSNTAGQPAANASTSPSNSTQTFALNTLMQQQQQQQQSSGPQVPNGCKPAVTNSNASAGNPNLANGYFLGGGQSASSNLNNAQALQ